MLFLANGGDSGKFVFPVIGYRYFSYNKPLAIIDFYGSEVKSDMSWGNPIQADELIAGYIAETEIKGHLLLLGILDGSYIGLPSDAWYFFDLLFYTGSADVNNSSFESKGRIAAGMEVSAGLKYSYRISRSSGLTGRFGFRYLAHKVAFAEKIGEDEKGEKYRGSYIEEQWYGPFVSISMFF
jgi:hypothetical protein